MQARAAVARFLNTRQERPSARRRQSFDDASNAAKTSGDGRKQESDIRANVRHCFSKLTRHQLEPGRHRFQSLRRGQHRDDFEVGDVAPIGDSFIEEAPIVEFHDLKATAQVVGDPASSILDAVWYQPPSIAEPLVDRNGIAASKALDDHVQHTFRFRRSVFQRHRRERQRQSCEGV